MKRSLEERLLNPPQGSKAAAAKEAGADLEELLENLKLTPTQRVEKLQKTLNLLYEEHEKIINLNDTTRAILCHKREGFYLSKKHRRELFQ